MDWIPVILALAVLGVIGLIFGLVLSFADKKLKVETDPRIAQVRELRLCRVRRVCRSCCGRQGEAGRMPCRECGGPRRGNGPFR